MVYGDTASVFVEYPGWISRACKAHSRQVLTPALNAQLPVRTQVKHEKVLAPLLLQHIRRYAGYENLNDGYVTTGCSALRGHHLEIEGIVSESNYIQAAK